jgi:DNA-binding NarL/FixJ family response regulator
MIDLDQRRNSSSVPSSYALSEISVLIVDPLERWRRFVADLLEQAGGVYAASFASDGPEAVRKAVELRPNVVLTDVGLPTLSGIEAARHTRQFVPESKIIFLSSLSDPTIVRAAIRAGGRGYVLKADAQAELLGGMEAVLGDGFFLSESLSYMNSR